MIFQASYYFPNFRTEDVQGSLNMGPDMTTTHLSWLVQRIVILEFLIFKHLNFFYVCNWSGSLSFPLGVQVENTSLNEQPSELIESSRKWAASVLSVGKVCGPVIPSLPHSPLLMWRISSPNTKDLSELNTLDFCFNIRNTITWNLRYVLCEHRLPMLKYKYPDLWALQYSALWCWATLRLQ